MTAALVELAHLVRDRDAMFHRPRRRFHETSAPSPSEHSTKNPQRAVRDLILRAMKERRLTSRALAARMDGDELRNRSLLALYLSDPGDPMPLGSVLACRIEQALGLSDGALRGKKPEAG